MEWTVTYDESGSRLVDFIFKRTRGVQGRKAIRRALERNAGLVNGQIERFATVPVSSGDRVRFRDQVAAPKGQFLFESGRVLYQDDYLLIYNKPVGISVEKLQPLICKALGEWQMVHRIDRFTSGVWILARPGQSAASLEKQFRQRGIKKKYFAIVDGVPAAAHGTESSPIDDRPAKTRWELVWSRSEQSMVACYPESGRHHQVRIHMMRLGHPLLGDRDYAQVFRCKRVPQHYLLHAAEVALEHPMSGDELVIKAAAPSTFGKG